MVDISAEGISFEKLLYVQKILAVILLRRLRRHGRISVKVESDRIIMQMVSRSNFLKVERSFA